MGRVTCFSFTWSHLLECVLVDKMMIVFIEGAVERDAVGLE